MRLCKKNGLLWYVRSAMLPEGGKVRRKKTESASRQPNFKLHPPATTLLLQKGRTHSLLDGTSLVQSLTTTPAASSAPRRALLGGEFSFPTSAARAERLSPVLVRKGYGKLTIVSTYLDSLAGSRDSVEERSD